MKILEGISVEKQDFKYTGKLLNIFRFQRLTKAYYKCFIILN